MKKPNNKKEVEIIQTKIGEDCPVSVSTSNSKLGKFIPNVNTQAIVTCRPDAPCKKNCYACRGVMRIHQTKTYAVNTEYYKANPQSYFDYISGWLGSGLVIYKYFRWHSSGDIIDEKYFALMCELAEKHKETKFLCFTKKFEIVNKYLDSGKIIPKNLNIVFSDWGLWHCYNPYNLPTTNIIFKKSNDRFGENKYLPKNAFKCNSDCEKCQKCWHLGKGETVVFDQH